MPVHACVQPLTRKHKGQRVVICGHKKETIGVRGAGSVGGNGCMKGKDTDFGFGRTKYLAVGPPGRGDGDVTPRPDALQG